MPNQRIELSCKCLGLTTSLAKTQRLWPGMKPKPDAAYNLVRYLLLGLHHGLSSTQPFSEFLAKYGDYWRVGIYKENRE